jgi:pimeloyl-ACP methyl ester carboxylesterase
MIKERSARSSPSLIRKALRLVIIVCAAFVACIVLLAGWICLHSPGTPVPVLSADGKPLARSISEKLFLRINGVEQGMFIKGTDTLNPVLLYLHGGMPDYFLTARYPTGLENHFTVVWWEQRGAGISFNPDIPRETMTVEQLISDTRELTNYLRERFGKDKIYLMAHSGGTFFGIQAAARMPELYHAYIGVSQMSYQLGSEKLAYEFMLRRFRELGDSSMVRRLEKAPVILDADVPPGYNALRDEAMHTLGVGTMHDITSVISGIFWPSLLFPEYTFLEKVRMWSGKSRSGISILWDSMVKTDLAQEVTRLGIPVYFFHGIHDYTCSYPLARSYFDEITAPVKGFYTFERSAHSPMFEEPERMGAIIAHDVLAGVNTMADAK